MVMMAKVNWICTPVYAIIFRNYFFFIVSKTRQDGRVLKTHNQPEKKILHEHQKRYYRKSKAKVNGRRRMVAEM